MRRFGYFCVWLMIGALPAFGAAIIVLLWAGLMVFKTSPQPAVQAPAVAQGQVITGEPAAFRRVARRGAPDVEAAR